MKKSRVTSFVLTSTKQQLKREAKKKELSESDLVNRIIEAHYQGK